MRQIFAVLFILFFLSTNAQTLPVESTTAQTQPLLISQNQYAREVNAAQYPAVPQSPAQKELKLVIVTLDGYRWQEQFGGVSKMLQKRLFGKIIHTRCLLYLNTAGKLFIHFIFWLYKVIRRRKFQQTFCAYNTASLQRIGATTHTKMWQ